jgi:hypothetical protein
MYRAIRADCFQRPLRSRFQQQLRPSVSALAFSPSRTRVAAPCEVLRDQRTSNTSLPCRWRDSLTRCASAASVSL